MSKQKTKIDKSFGNLNLNDKQNDLNIMDLCAGTGGFSVAFKTIENVEKKCKTVYANDIENSSEKIFNLNFDIKLDLRSIHDIDLKKLNKNIDILTCGFPCQSFSIAGKRLGFSDERSNVFWTIINIIKEIKPKSIVLENVKNLLTHDNNKTFTIICDALKAQGYFIKYKILDTAKYTEIPQHRERLYIIGFLSEQNIDKFEFPKMINKIKNISAFLEKKVDDKFYYHNKNYKVCDLINKCVVNHINTNSVYQYRRTIVRENKSAMCPTLTANMGKGGHNVPIIKDDIGIRKLTPRECFNLQGFPITYKLPILSDSKLYTLAGNCITVPLVELIATNIIKILN